MIISRLEWGAMEPKKRLIRIFPDKIIIHHHGFKTKQTKVKTSERFRGKETIKYLQQVHMNKYGFVDIGFHFIIGPNGDIYEGRALDFAGCHCEHHNNHSIGILIFGNFNSEKPNRAEIHSLFYLFKMLNKKYKHLKFPDCIFNHSDLNFTICPGHHLRNMINVIKKTKGVIYE
jgi:N-acetyl-anhydromuramyl-L-alanine amidase AmpD